MTRLPREQDRPFRLPKASCDRGEAYLRRQALASLQRALESPLPQLEEQGTP